MICSDLAIERDYLCNFSNSVNCKWPSLLKLLKVCFCFVYSYAELQQCMHVEYAFFREYEYAEVIYINTCRQFFFFRKHNFGKMFSWNFAFTLHIKSF